MTPTWKHYEGGPPGTTWSLVLDHVDGRALILGTVLDPREGETIKCRAQLDALDAAAALLGMDRDELRDRLGA